MAQNIISFLMRHTSTGSTYLQAGIMVILLAIVGVFFIAQAVQIIRYVKNEFAKD